MIYLVILFYLFYTIYDRNVDISIVYVWYVYHKNVQSCYIFLLKRIHFSIFFCNICFVPYFRIISWYLDGNSEIGAHVKNNLCYLICLRHLIKSRAVTNQICFAPKRPMFLWREIWYLNCIKHFFRLAILYYFCNTFFLACASVLSYHLIYAPCIICFSRRIVFFFLSLFNLFSGMTSCMFLSIQMLVLFTNVPNWEGERDKADEK